MEPNVFEVVSRYLRREIPEIELRRWLTGCYEWLEGSAAEDQREFGLTAMNFGFILQSGEWTEEAFRHELEREYRKALKQRPSRVS
jgi:hypothetical protein